MATIQLPALPAATQADDADLFLMRQGSVDKKVSKTILLDGIDTSISELKGLLTSTGGGNAYILTTGGTISTLSVPMAWVFKANHTSSGASTLQIDSAPTADILTPRGLAIGSEAIYTGGIYFAVFDGTNFICINAHDLATDTYAGTVELATTAEADTGTATDRAVTPEGLLSSILANAPVASAATTLIEGIIELATNAEVQTGSDTSRAVTPAGLKSLTSSTARKGLIETATVTEAANGIDNERAVTPQHMLTSHDDAIVQALAQVPVASTILQGKVELATNTETQDGVATGTAVTPAGLKSLTATETRSGLSEVATQVEIDAGTDDLKFATPLKLKSWVRDATEVIKGFVAKATQAEVDAAVETDKFVTPAHLSSLSITGQIIIMGGPVVPAGHLECAGGEVSRTTYANLYAAIGNTWGAGNGTTTFNLPDMRGEFARGWDHGRGVDSGRGIGTFQDEEFKAHSHKLPQDTGSGLPKSFDNVQGFGTFQHDSEVVGGDETRPRNVTVMYCIRT